MPRDVAKPIALAISILVISLAHYATDPSHLLLHEIFQDLYFLPVIVGAYWYGLAGGLITALGTSLAYIPHIQWTWSHDLRVAADRYAELVIFFLIGTTVGVLSSAQRKLTARYRETAASLERSHRELLDSQEHLKRAERLSVLGQVAAGLAHEIRNPLAGLKGALEIIASRVAPGTPEAEFAGIAARDAARLDGLVSDFLTYARPRDPELREIDLCSVIAHVTTVSRPEADRSGVSLAIEASRSPIAVRVDREQMTQVILNVVLNAIQASPLGGTIRIQPRSEVDSAVVEVSDQGPGISPEHLTRIFEPFFTTKQRGTGLGLAISQRIVLAHNGSIDVVRSSPAATTFRVRLPLVTRPVADASEAVTARIS
jgi:two-component system, NtrC family, sensor histidine kinase HydH